MNLSHAKAQSSQREKTKKGFGFSFLPFAIFAPLREIRI
jgi:hypothetical protein